MARLDEFVPGKYIKGLTEDEALKILCTEMYGPDAAAITCRSRHGLLERTISAEEAARLTVTDQANDIPFDADGEDLKLASEACRIRLAYLFDPYLAVHTSSVEPLPHQISAVYQEMLPKLPLRYILADDPGAGKTIMTGLFMKELIARGDLQRCLIVCPGSLVEQWQDELYSKFHLPFQILTNDLAETAVTGNIFAEKEFLIARLDHLARNEALMEKLKVTDWDLIVCDEAHKMSATYWGVEVKRTKRYQLGELLSTIGKHFLLLTATPHNGKDDDFQLFLSLIDPDRFASHAKMNVHTDVSGIMRRLTKEELLKFDGTPLFPERRAYTVNYKLSPQENELYQAVTDYVQEEFNRADQLSSGRKNTVGFALTILQRRLASSPEAIYQSLSRRRKRLEQWVADEKAGRHSTDKAEPDIFSDDYDDDDLPPEELEALENSAVSSASAAATVAEMEKEIGTLRRLEAMADAVRMSGVDRKWEELSRLLQDERTMFTGQNQREKLILFTEHRDTLNYLAEKISALLGNADAVVTIHGGMSRDKRREAEARFRQDGDVRILVATDAAGEGINLQRAHLMINYDLPWNPNRLEQRFGRIHRIGQTEVCHLWNLVAEETREGCVFQRLFRKLEEERKALGGKVFDILGKISFDGKTLRDLLIEAVRYGNDPAVRARLSQVVDASLDPAAFQAILDQNALTADVMNAGMVSRIRETMERAEAHRLQPHFIESFFLAAFRRLGGRILAREPGRYEIRTVPASVKSARSGRMAVQPRYERICFDKSLCTSEGHPLAEQVCPGHPLLEAVETAIDDACGSALRRGAILIDDSDRSDEASLLFYIEHTIQDDDTRDGAPHIISRTLHFMEWTKTGISPAGYAPYLDLRGATPDEAAAVRAWMKTRDWLGEDRESAVKAGAMPLLNREFEEVQQRRTALLDKTAKAVRNRLISEIHYWDRMAAELKEKEKSGRHTRLSYARAARRAEELDERMKERLRTIEREKTLSRLPLQVVGQALVIPRSLLARLLPGRDPAPDSAGRKAVEAAAMAAVMAIERDLGYLPRDVSADKCGYDVESAVPPSLRGPDGHTLRFIEVKGRAAGADTVTVSRNEMLCALNNPDQFYLAIVEVDGPAVHTLYLKHPRFDTPGEATACTTYRIRDLAASADIVYEK